MKFNKFLPLLLILLFSQNLFAGQKSLINQKDWSFIENKGQLIDENGNKLTDVKYYGRQGNTYLYCRQNTISFVFSKIENDLPVSESSGESINDKFALRQALMKQATIGSGKLSLSRIDMMLNNSQVNSEIIGSELQDYYQNFYTSAASENGILHVQTFKTITYKNIYNHIDLVIHCRESGLKYEFIVRPGGNPKEIEIQWNGANKMALMQNGGLTYGNRLGEIKESNPVSYLNSGKPISSSFIKNNNRISFKTGKYDKTETLIIDPTLTWATYLGGSAVDNTQAMWLDNLGNVVVTGQTQSSSGIATSGAFLTSYSGAKGQNDAFLSKFSASGTMLWSTYYGNTGYDDGWAVNIDKYNNIYMIGTTNSTSGIATSGAYQTSMGGSYNAYFVKFSPSGTRFWATYFGNTGADQGLFLTLDPNNNIFITCWITSTSGIATSGAYQTSFGGVQDASLEKFDSTGSKLLWSTYFGGSGSESVNTVAADVNGNAIICGWTPSTSGIASSGAYQTSYGGGGEDAFMASFSSSGGLNWATYLGGSANDMGWGVTTDASGNVYACGQSASTSGIATSGAYQTNMSGTANAFLSKFSSKGNLIWSTYYGGGGTDVANNLTTDGSGNVFITGATSSSYGIASSGAVQSSNAGSNDAFFARFLPNGSFAYGSYFGGSGTDYGWDLKVDKSGNVYVTGGTQSSSGIATSGAYQTVNGGSDDVFLAEFNFKVWLNDAGIAAIQSPARSFCTGTNSVKVKLTNYGSKDLTAVTIGWMVNKKVQTSYSWTGKLNKDSSAIITIGSYSFPSGIDTITAWTTKPNSVLDSFPKNDTAKVADTVNALPKPSAGSAKNVCAGSSTNIGMTAIKGHTYAWVSNPSGFTSTLSQTTVSPSTTTTYYLTETITGGGCSATDSVKVSVYPIPTPNVGGTKSVCYGGSVTIGSAPVKNHSYVWSSVPSGFSSTLAQPTVNPTTTTTYYETETDTIAGCFAYANGVVTVSAPLTASAGGNHQSCTGVSVTLGAAATSGHTYSWTSKPKGFTSTLSNPVASPTVTTVYYVTEVITSSGCIKMDSAVITISPAPNANAGGNRSICAGSSLALGTTATTGHTYTWTSKPAGFTSTTSNPTVSPTVQTIYYVTEKNTATGCTKTDSAIIKTNPLPITNAGGSNTICQGDKFQLGTSSTAGITYAWTSKPKGFTSTISNPQVSPTASTNYYLTATITATGCAKTDSAVITVSAVAPKAGGNHTICQGTTVNLGGPTTVGHTYQWTSIPGTYSSTISNPTVTPTTSTTYVVTETISATGCTKNDTAIIKVNAAPAAKTITSPASVCLGSSILIGASPVNSSTYTWKSKPIGFSSIDNNPSVSPKTSTWYYLTETNTATGCNMTDSIKVNVLPVPNAKWYMTYAGKTTILYAGDSSLASAKYKWTFGDPSASGTNADTATGHQVSHIYPKNKTYPVSLKVTGANGCVGQYDSSLLVKVSGIEWAELKTGNYKLNVYPNPFLNTTTIGYTLLQTTSIKITLTDISGKEVAIILKENQIAGDYQTEIHAEKYKLLPGTYLLKMNFEGEMVTRQLLKL